MRVIVTGDDQLIAKIERFRQMSDLQKAYDDAGETVADIAERLVPVKTGRLRDSIRHRSLTQKAVVQAGRRSFPYAPIVHYGQKPGWQAQPFLTSALAVANYKIPFIFHKEMDKAMHIANV